MKREDLSKNLVESIFIALDKGIRSLLEKAQIVRGSFRTGYVIYEFNSKTEVVLDKFYERCGSFFESMGCQIIFDRCEGFDLIEGILIICENNQVFINFEMSPGKLEASIWVR